MYSTKFICLHESFPAKVYVLPIHAIKIILSVLFCYTLNCLHYFFKFSYKL